VWEIEGPKSGQEYANHTWDHEGARNYQEADFQIGESARYIWKLRGAGASKLLAFSRGGGTTWNISDSQMEELLKKYHCLRRTSDLSARTDYGVDADKLVSKAQEAISERSWISVHFHGIGSEWLSIDTQSFFHLLDYISDNKDNLWNAGWSAAFQYVKERDNAVIDVLEQTETQIRIRLTTGLNTELFVEPLTLITDIPDSWSTVVVAQDNLINKYSAENGKLQYEAIPDSGEIILQPEG
jgi:hypothetical protein